MPGDVKYMDLNNDKKINNGNNTLEDMGDMCVIGNTTPRYQYTLNGSISWKGISLSMMFQGIGKRNWSPDLGTVYFWGIGSLCTSHGIQRSSRLLDSRESRRLLSQSLYRSSRKYQSVSK